MSVIDALGDHDEPTTGWQEYYRQHADREPRPELSEALSAVREVHPDLGEISALEVGAGAMVEARALLDAGVGRVLATDYSPGALKRSLGLSLQYNQDAERFDRFEFEQIKNEDLPELLAPTSQDLIISYNTLSYTHPDAFPETWQALLGALRPGGVISASFLGDRDHWNRKYSGMTFVSREDVASMTDSLMEISVNEKEEEVMETSGEKRHGHTITVVGRKPLSDPEASTI